MFDLFDRADALSKDVVSSIFRRLPPSVLLGSDEANDQRKTVLLDGLASRLARIEYIASLGWFGRFVFSRKLRELMLKSGYSRSFAESAVKALMLKR